MPYIALAGLWITMVVLFGILVRKQFDEISRLAAECSAECAAMSEVCKQAQIDMQQGLADYDARMEAINIKYHLKG